MTDVIVFPDAVALVIAHLKTQFATRSVTAEFGTRLPTPLDGHLPFVRVFRTGGLAEQRVIDKAQLTIEAYAEDTATAHDVAQLVRGLMHAMVGMALTGTAVTGVTEFSGPQDFPDPLTNKPRYSFTVQVGMKGSTA